MTRADVVLGGADVVEHRFARVGRFERAPELNSDPEPDPASISSSPSRSDAAAAACLYATSSACRMSCSRAS